MLIHGKNGVGKTTVVQAIEWCLMGKCGHMELDEFGREDALVNLFHPDKRATVVMQLTDGTRSIQLIRRRGMAKSTRGKTDFSLIEDKRQSEGPDAEQKAISLLSLNPQQFYASICLRQEAIRDLVVGDAEVRGRVIDELLGLEELRQLAEAIPVRDVENAVKKVEHEADEIQTSTIQALDLAKKKLTSYERELQKAGFKEKQLTSESLALMASEIAERLTEIATSMKSEPPKFRAVKQDTTILRNVYEELNEHLERLDHDRFGIFKGAESQRSKLQGYLDDYKDACNHLAEFKEKNSEKMQEAVDTANEKADSLEEEIDSKSELAEFLSDRKSLVKGLQSDINRAADGLKKLEKYGSVKEIDETIHKFETEIADATKMKKEVGAYIQLLKSASDYIGGTKPTKCPVCNRPIDHGKIKRELSARMSKSETAKIEDIDERIDSLKDRKKEYTNAKSEMPAFAKQVEDAEADLAKQMQEIEKKIQIKLRKPYDEFLARQISELKDSVKPLKEDSRNAREKALGLAAELKELKNAARSKQNLEEKIQNALAIKETDAKLLQMLQRQVGNLEKEIERLNELNKRFPELKSEVTNFRKILEYLEESERVRKLEDEIPGAKEKIQELKTQSDKLQELFMGLMDISEALKAEKDSILQSTLDKLQAQVGSYYSKILAHPYFVNLQITPEEEKKGTVYRIIAYDATKSHSTYVQTRFSNAQTNVTALSLFLAMADATASKLGLIMLDDPGQSLDLAHKEALAKILADEAKQKQIILATQDEEMRSLLQAAIPKSRLRTVAFGDWTPECGPQLTS